MSSIKKIASVAGVSVSTVSNVLNGRGKASQKTIDRVKKLALDLGYEPSLIAQGLVTNRTRLIGVVTALTERENKFLLSNPFYSEVINGLEFALRSRGYNLILMGVLSDAPDLVSFVRWQVDGLVVLGGYDGELLNAIERLSCPTIALDTQSSSDNIVNVDLDDENAIKQAVDHLVSFGHEKIAFVGGALNSGGVIERRLRGFESAMFEAGLSVDPKLVHCGFVAFEYGQQCSQALSNDNCTAVVCTADVLALGVIHGLTERGLRVPEDKSVVGFDDLPVASMVYPSLTTVSQGLAARGRLSGDLIVDLVEGQDSQRKIVSPTELICRQTVSTPRVAT